MQFQIFLHPKNLKLLHLFPVLPASDSSLALALDVAVSEAVGKIAASASTGTTVTSSNISLTAAGLGSSSSSTNFTIQESEEVLGFPSDTQAFLDKGCTN